MVRQVHEIPTTSPSPDVPSGAVEPPEERGRSRSRTRRPTTPEALTQRGYHSFQCHGRAFYVEKRWRLVRELGQGAYGLVVSAQDNITGECVAIKMITRLFEKPQLAKRALREITLLRHFSNHENITGLIDMDVVTPGFNEIYLYMEPMEADLYQIIRSQQSLTNAHVQYFLYQILRGVKYIHSANVVHRDLKPGNLLVNADCELKICDLGLARGYDARPDEQGTQMTEYVATRWYRAPEIMLSFRRYNAAIDMWSIGCILGELLGGKPMFKGKDYVDQLNCILNVLGTPDQKTITRIGSDKAQAYIRSLPVKKVVPFKTLFPNAEPDALDLLSKLLAFDPADRINVLQALEHPYLASYHEVGDEPSCPQLFERWRDIEKIDTMADFRVAIQREVDEFRAEVRSIEKLDEIERLEEVARQAAALHYPGPVIPNTGPKTAIPKPIEESDDEVGMPMVVPFPSYADEEEKERHDAPPGPIPPIPRMGLSRTVSELPPRRRVQSSDPFSTYVRKTSLLSSQAPLAAQPAIFYASFFEPPKAAGDTASAAGATTTAVSGIEAAGGIVDEPSTFRVPTRSRGGSTDGGVMGPLLRQLSTVSISDTVPMQKMAAVVDGGAEITAADAPASSLPVEFQAHKRESGTSNPE